MVLRTSTAFAAISLAAFAAHSENRELDAHEHGHGTLNIAFEGPVVAMELEAPGADIVGFEYKAKTAEDRARIDAAIARLAKPLELFLLPASAGCVVTAANVELIVEGEHDDHVEGAKDDHDHDHNHGHGDEQADGDEDAGHTEFHAEYQLNCDDPAAIGTIDFAYFGLFPNAVELDVQMISDKGAKGFEVKKTDPRLDLAGSI